MELLDAVHRLARFPTLSRLSLAVSIVLSQEVHVWFLLLDVGLTSRYHAFLSAWPCIQRSDALYLSFGTGLVRQSAGFWTSGTNFKMQCRWRHVEALRHSGE